VSLLGSTGRSSTRVFQMLSDGKRVHRLPGRAALGEGADPRPMADAGAEESRRRKASTADRLTA
jgi:hypothetical protein